MRALSSAIAAVLDWKRLIPPKPPVHTDGEQRAVISKIVARYSVGNASLQLGRFVTKSDIDRKKRQVTPTSS